MTSHGRGSQLHKQVIPQIIYMFINPLTSCEYSALAGRVAGEGDRSRDTTLLIQIHKTIDDST